MPTQTHSFFDGVPPPELAEFLERLERRRFPAGSVVVAEGDTSHEVYITQRGTADVFVADRQGVEHRVGHIAAGATVGEMSLFTGQPAAGTVRASEELEVVVLTESDFERMGSRFPQIYRNLGAILSERLARTNRLTFGEAPGRLVLLDDDGAPPLLAYALAASVAWHTRTPTALVAVTDRPAQELAALATRAADRGTGGTGSPNGAGRPAADVLVTEHLTATHAAELAARYEHVLVLRSPGARVSGEATKTIALRPPGAAAPAGVTYSVQGWRDGERRLHPRDGTVAVPALVPSDEEQLREGRLGLTAGAGRALGWVARDLAGLRVGVALGAGSVMGFAHFGVLRGLDRLGLPIDAIAGTSVGSAAGGLYALGHEPDAAAEIFTACGATLFRPTLSRKSLLSNRALKKFLRGMSPEGRIEELDIPFAAVAADLASQREVVFREGLLWQAVLASISIPGVYPALQMGPYSVVDGGVLDPVPTGIAAELGADTIVGVKLMNKPAEANVAAAAVDPGRRGAPSALTSILRSIEIMQSRVTPEATDSTTVMLLPELGNVPPARLRAFREGLRYLDIGEAAVEAARPRLAAALPWLRT